MKYEFRFILMAIAIVMFGCQQTKKDETPKAPPVVEEPTAVKVKGEEVVYSADSTSMKGYIAYDANITTKRPGIIVIHEWWGHNNYVRERADQLAELGYTAIAIDMYGDGQTANHPDDAGKFAMSVMSDLPEATARFNAAMELLKAHKSVDPDRIAAIGYCFGGSVALTMANSGADLDAVAAFHSGVQLPVMPGKDLKARVLVCNGADDPFVSAESVTAFKSAMDGTGLTYEYIAYPGVVHSFTSKEADANGEKFQLPLKYDSGADAQSWERMTSLFSEVF